MITSPWLVLACSLLGVAIAVWNVLYGKN